VTVHCSAVGHYVTFLLDSQSGAVIDGSVSDAPSPRRPEDLFQWKITCDARGEVAIRRWDQGPPQLIGTASWDRGALAGFRQYEKDVPTDQQWIKVATALGRELAKRETRGGAEDASLVELVSKREGRQLYGRSIDWASLGPRHDRNGVDLYAMRKVKQVLLGVGVMVVIGIVAFVYSLGRSPSSPSPREAEPTRPSPPSPPSVEQQVASAPTFTAAIALGGNDPTGMLLARYAKLRWSDVEAPETTIGRVQKDADAERGKRLCAEGTIDRIERRDLDRRKVYVGRLTQADGDSVELVALGTTGDLVKRSPAKFCGAVVSKNTDAPVIVGLFDLPENRSPIVEQ
jgi:hypothetical protein